MDNQDRILQVNVERDGGVFSLVFSVNCAIKESVKFDYYTMKEFPRDKIYEDLLNIGSRTYAQGRESNKLINHICLPFDFYRFLKKQKYNTIHVHSDSAWKLLVYIIPAKAAHVDRIIVHSHSSYVNGKFEWIKKTLHKLSKIFLPVFATDFCTCSKEASEWMYPDKVKKKVYMIHNGIDVNKFCFDLDARIKLRSKLGLKENNILLGTVGNFSYQKNPEFIIHIFENLCKASENFYLIFVGSGNEEDNIKRYAVKNGLSDKVIFYGKTNNVAEILNAFDVFLLPSRSEGLPVCGIEAQANGLPVLFSDHITKDIDYIENSRYLPIDIGSEKVWCQYIQSIFPEIDGRKEGINRTIEHQFNIEYTTEEFLKLYHR